MVVQAISAILRRDLATLRREIEVYDNDEQVWETPAGLSNSAGTLALHLAGNLQYYIGSLIGGSGYVRDRPAEFSRRNLSRGELLAEIDRAMAAVERGLRRLPESKLAEPFPEVVGGVRVATGDFLIHLAVHLTYHLGQVNYHRRIVTGRSETVNAVRAAELSTAEPVAS